jgi:FAD/FMN-containing dehydrogenase
MYSSDIGVLPKLVKPLMPTGLAGAVVRPATEEQVAEIVRLARAEGLKLVPRGMSTSGYGGVLPVPGAVVVDLSGLDPLVDIDTEAKTVRAGAGVIWEGLQKAVNKSDLDLRLYPSSLPSSTVGGWLAQGSVATSTASSRTTSCLPA